MDIYPTLKYDDAEAAIGFLTGAFGLKPAQISRNDDGSVGHCELSSGQGVVMLSGRSTPSGPYDTGRAVLYVRVDDVDAHYATALAAGATIEYPPRDQPYASREYAARDTEGNLWSFGTYLPDIPS